MVTTTSTRGSTLSPNPSVDRGWLRTALVWNLVFQIGIIVTGGLVRLTGSGLGCSTWPECVPGSYVPTRHQAEGYHKFIEFGNRTLTGVLSVGAILVLVGAYKFAKDRPQFQKLAWLPFIGVAAQAIVGGITVRVGLNPAIVAFHFIASAALVAVSTYLLHLHDDGDAPARLVVHPVLARLAVMTAWVGGVVVFLGTLVTGSGPHSGDADAPARLGFDPRSMSWLHADAVMLFCGLVIACLVAGIASGAPARFTKAWTYVLVLCVAQAVIGYGQFFTGLPWALVLVHMLGAGLLCWLVTDAAMTARTRRAA